MSDLSRTDDDAIGAVAIAATELPLIDFTPFREGDRAARQGVADQIARACETIGFFYLCGHGVPETLRSDIFDRADAFFHLPPEQKAQARATDAWNRGWVCPDRDATLTSNSRLFEQYRIQREFAPDDPDLRSGSVFCQPNRWPSDVAGFDRASIAYFEAMSALARDLLHAFALGLGLPEDRFDRYFTKPISQISLMYYPPLPASVGAEIKNTSAHTDDGAVVILAQGAVPGLEVKTVDGRWLAAPPVPGAFTINVGNMMMWWTNGRYRSTLHRVRNTSAVERYSVPFFFNADESVVIEPLAELVAADGEARYKPVHVGTLLSRFFKSSTYVPIPQDPGVRD
jgi:isopenicillin N synthase-like dioxygenase